MPIAVTIGSVFEAAMLVCFGVGWPVSILKTLRTRRVTGKSLGFLVLIFVGYVSGVLAKVVRAAGGEPLEWVTILYAINGLMVAFEIALYVRYSPRDRADGVGIHDVPVE